jgi:hypothetical protein
MRWSGEGGIKHCSPSARDRAGVDLLTERRLRNVQPICGMGEVQLLGGSDEVFKMAELHGRL